LITGHTLKDCLNGSVVLRAAGAAAGGGGGGTLGMEGVRKIMRGILAGVAVCHEEKIIHRCGRHVTSSLILIRC